jgi:hypothetical protein
MKPSPAARFGACGSFTSPSASSDRGSKILYSDGEAIDGLVDCIAAAGSLALSSVAPAGSIAAPIAPAASINVLRATSFIIGSPLIRVWVAPAFGFSASSSPF